MKKIDKNNLESFIEYYNGLHDSYFTNIIYDILGETIDMDIDVFWSGEPTLKEDGTFETNKTKIKMKFSGIKKCKVKELYSFYIDNIYFNYINYNKNEVLCFATDELDPEFYIICENVEYEEIATS